MKFIAHSYKNKRKVFVYGSSGENIGGFICEKTDWDILRKNLEAVSRMRGILRQASGEVTRSIEAHISDSGICCECKADLEDGEEHEASCTIGELSEVLTEMHRLCVVTGKVTVEEM